MPRGEQQTTESADAARGEGLVRPRGESLEEREESREHLRDGHHRGVKMRGEVDDELQAVLARLVEPRVRLGLVRVRRGRVALGGVLLARAHVVEDGEEDGVVHSRPEPGAEIFAVKLERVEEHLERGSTNLGSRVEGELGETREEREPEKDVHVRVRERRGALLTLARSRRRRSRRRRRLPPSTSSSESGTRSRFPSEPSASLSAQNRRNARALRLTTLSCTPLFVKAMRQLTQSVKVVASVSVMWSKCSRMMDSMVSNARVTTAGFSSPAAVVNTMNMDFQPLLMLLTCPRTIWDMHRMMSSRISVAWDCRITTTKGRRKSFWNE